jgi:hypothetical protein
VRLRRALAEMLRQLIERLRISVAPAASHTGVPAGRSEGFDSLAAQAQTVLG